MCNDSIKTDRTLTPEEHSKRRAHEAKAQADQANYGLVSGAGANQIMDKRIAVSALHQRASMLRGQADGLERLAELVGAASTYDMTLFSTVLALVGERR